MNASNLNIERVTQLMAQNQTQDPFAVLLGLDYVEQPMSINAYCAEAAKDLSAIEFCRYHIEQGCYRDLGVTFDQFKAAAEIAAKSIK